jgi:hypothetical protein
MNPPLFSQAPINSAHSNAVKLLDNVHILLPSGKTKGWCSHTSQASKRNSGEISKITKPSA